MVDIAPSTSENNTVFVVGNDETTIFPVELDYLQNIPFYEDRYKQSFWMKDTMTNNADPYMFNFIFWNQDKWMRVRSQLFYWVFQQNQLAPSVELTTTFTPIPAMGCTYFDEIQILYGTNGISVLQATNLLPHAIMMNFFGNTRKSEMGLNNWAKMAGFEDFKTFDYLGGMVGSVGTFPDPAVSFPAGANYPSIVAANGSQIGQYMVMPPFYNRSDEPGFWLDKGMQRMRVAFKGNQKCTTAAYLVRSSYYTNIHETHTLQPPLKLEYKFRITDPTRPRYICSPSNQPTNPLGSSTVVLGTDVVPSSNLVFNYIISNTQSYALTQNVEMRSDIHQALLDSWANSGSAFTVTYTYTSIFLQSGITNVSQTIVDIVGRYGNIPYKTLIASQVQYGSGTLPNGTAWPPRNALCEFAYGDNHVSQYKTNVTTPYSREFTMELPIMWPSTDPISIANQTTRGVINPQYVTNQKFLSSQGMENPEFADCDSYDPLDVWDKQMSIPVGYVQPGQTAPSVVYGGHAISFSNGTVFNVGLHNYITTFFWPPIGYEDVNIDNGIYKGNVRMTINFGVVCPGYLNFYFLNYYRIGFMMIGNGTCQTNLQLP